MLSTLYVEPGRSYKQVPCNEGLTLLSSEASRSQMAMGLNLDQHPPVTNFHFHGDPRKNKAMKKSITSNWRPLLRALYPFVIGIAVLWAMPRTAHAQLYVAELPGGGPIGVVDKYDAKTGAAISPGFITGLNNPVALAVIGNTLFVASADSFTPGSGTVGKYDAKTGAAISPSFITGLTAPLGLAVLGNTLFVGNNLNTVSEYDAKTGAAINASLITGLTDPFGLAVKSAK
jgi:hypothetical protein